MRKLNRSQLFRMSCYYPSKLGVIPLKWHKKKQRLVFRCNDTSGLTSKRKLYITYLIYSFIPLQGLQCYYLDPNSYNFSFTDNLIYCLVVLGLFTSTSSIVSCVVKASSQLHYINGIMEFSKNKETSFQEKSMIKKLDFALAVIATPSASIGPFLFLYGMQWFSPCKPSVAGYSLIPQCSSDITGFENAVLNFVVKVIVFAANHWLLAAALSVVSYCACFFVCLGVLSFDDFLQIFEEMTGDDTEKGIYKGGICYRKIQILGCLCNEVQQSDLMIAGIVGATLVLIMAINAAFVVPWTVENAPGLVVFGLCTINMGLFLLVCVGAMAEILQGFEDVLGRLKKRGMILGYHQKRLCFKWRERFYLSCTPVKFKIGKFNFVETLTPLNCVMFAIDQSVSILLLGKEY